MNAARRHFRSSLATRWCLGFALLVACEPTDSTRSFFTEITAELGLADRSPRWPDGRYRIAEISVGGLALFDSDGDGDLDIYQVCHPPPDRPDAPAPNRLFRRQSDGSFREVASDAGLDERGYGSGVALGDADGDGDLDLYVTNVGRDAFFVNEGDGRFTEATERSGLGSPDWSACAAFFDADRDGDLDLYVSHYLRDDPSRVCRTGAAERRDYCGPSKYQGVPDRFYRNRGDGTFEDVSAASGIVHARPGFGVVCADLTGDDWPDIYVANDMEPNLLYVNQRDGTFRDEAMERGVALDGAGKPEAGMGVDLGDVNGDGRADLFLTHLVDQTNTLYLAAGEGFFHDRSASAGLGGPSVRFTGWGCGFADFDHDGDLDLAVVNGRVARGEVLPGAEPGGFWSDYAEPNQLFINDGSGSFLESASRGGRFTSRVEGSRALAVGDLDGDGDPDLVVGNVDNGIRVFRNDAPAAGAHWIRVRARTGRRDALGARIAVTAGGTRQVRTLVTSGGFASANEPVAHFGLGEFASVEVLEVRWPGGATEHFAVEAVDRTVVLREGGGQPARAAEGETTPAGHSPKTPGRKGDPIAEGLAFLSEGDTNAAIASFNEAIRSGVRLFEAHQHRGKALAASGHTEAAISDLTRATELRPDDADTHYELATILRRANRPREALKSYAAALRCRPDLVKAYVDRAALYASMDRVEDAIRDCDRAQRLDPYSAGILVNRGVFYRRLGQVDRALADWNKAIRLDPQFPGGYFSRGVEHGTSGRYQDAVRDLSTTLELRPDHSAARQYRATAYQKLGRHREAIEDLSLLIERFPSRAAFYRQRADSYTTLGEGERARADLTRAEAIEK